MRTCNAKHYDETSELSYRNSVSVWMRKIGDDSVLRVRPLSTYVLFSLSRVRRRIKATMSVNASIWNALVVGEKHDDAVCAVNRHIMDRGYRTGRCHGDGGCFLSARRGRPAQKNDYYFVEDQVNKTIGQCCSRAAIPPHSQIRDGIAMLSDVSPRDDRATCNFKSTIRRGLHKYRPDTSGRQFSDAEQTWS